MAGQVQSDKYPMTIVEDGVLSTTFWSEPDLLNSSNESLNVDSGYYGNSGSSDDDNYHYGSQFTLHTISTPLSTTIHQTVSDSMDLSLLDSPVIRRSSLDQVVPDNSICSDCDSCLHDNSLLSPISMDVLHLDTPLSPSQLDQHKEDISTIQPVVLTSSNDTKKMSQSRKKSLSKKIKKMRHFLKNESNKKKQTVKILAYL